MMSPTVATRSKVFSGGAGVATVGADSGAVSSAAVVLAAGSGGMEASVVFSICALQPVTASTATDTITIRFFSRLVSESDPQYINVGGTQSRAQNVQLVQVI